VPIRATQRIEQRSDRRIDQRAVLAVLRREPPAEPGQRRQRDEGAQRRQLALQVLGDLLDQEVAERDAPKAALAVRDRIEDCRRRALRRDRNAPAAEQRRDRRRHLGRQRDLDEDQRLADERRVEEGEAAAVGGLETKPEVVPARDRMDRFVVDDLLEDVRRRRPVDPLQGEKAAVEPRPEEMPEVGVDGSERAVFLQRLQQILAHRDELARAAGCEVHASDQLLAARLGQRVQARRRDRVGLLRELGDRAPHELEVGAEARREEREEPPLVGARQGTVGSEQVRCERDTRCFALAREQHAGHRLEVGGRGDPSAAPPAGQSRKESRCLRVHRVAILRATGRSALPLVRVASRLPWSQACLGPVSGRCRAARRRAPRSFVQAAGFARMRSIQPANAVRNLSTNCFVSGFLIAPDASNKSAAPPM
jgi:hypothetical protein